MWRPNYWSEVLLKYKKDNVSVPEKTNIAPILVSAIEIGADIILTAFTEWLRNETTKHDSSYADLIYLYLANILEGENDRK